MSVNQRVDELFTLPPDEFTQARDRLVKELRATGDADRAAQVKALRRPTLAAWALNQLARDDPEGLQRLRDAGDALAREQRRALAGLDSSGLRPAQETRRQVTEGLLQQALSVLRDAGVAPDPHADALRGALDAAALDVESSRALLHGRLSRPPDPPSGFGSLSALSAVPSNDPPARAASAAQEQRIDEARRRLEAAQAEARAQRAEADAAAEQAQRKADDVQNLERELAHARRRAETADTRAQAARERAERAEAAVARRQEEVAQAEADVAAQP